MCVRIHDTRNGTKEFYFLEVLNNKNKKQKQSSLFIEHTIIFELLCSKSKIIKGPYAYSSFTGLIESAYLSEI